ncbi:NUDIX hydrolase [Halobacillus sp. H74]|uniref:NUDIX hydrolase n=1 Tax=Halobacillus sp. H74 TaxID=3457436 RepID=UPI003FCE6FA8
MKEMLTVFNNEGKPTGIKDRDEVHRDGEWHETFHCWFFEQKDKEIYLLFQQRSSEKKDFPDLFDITAAGHIEAQENLMTAGLREIKEELGLELKAEQVIKGGVFKEVLKAGTFIDKEICHVHFHRYTSALDFDIGNEVQDIVRVPLEQFSYLVTGECKRISGVSLLSEHLIDLVKEDFVPHEAGYERFIIQSICNYVEKL